MSKKIPAALPETSSAILIASLATLLLSIGVGSASAAPAWVPPELEPWVPWVTEGTEYRECPFLLGTRAAAPDDYRCAWPGVLEIDVDGDGGAFAQDWEIRGEEQWIALPGEAGVWPESVEVDGRPAPVYERASRPVLRLAPGRYRVSGRFRWQALPRTLRVPDETGIVALGIRGAPVSAVRRGDAGIFLAAEEPTTRSDDSLELQVYRLVEDEVPTRLTTRLQLEVAGGVREVILGPILPGGFVPESMTAPFPARLDPDGALRAQVAPGRWTVAITARAATLIETITRPAAGAAWPATEIWSYRADDRLRIAVPVGMTAVDPSQAGVPGPWQSLPAFAIEAGGRFRLEQRRRGGLLPENSLALDRSLWLDFDGGGYTALDQLRGTLYREWRLDMAAPYALMGARDQSGAPLLITASPDGEGRGIEWRSRDVMVNALSRVPRVASLPVGGWDARLGAVGTAVHLPPGYRLVAAPGADHAPEAWLNRWQLLDLFVVLLAAAAAGRLYGRTAGLLALATLVLIHQDLPLFSWLVLNLMAAVALAKSAPEGRLQELSRWYRHASLAALALVFVPFAVGQIRYTLYPQLESYAAYAPMRAPMTLPGAAVDQMQKAAESRLASEETMVASGARLQDSVRSGAPMTENRYEPGARVQTGPGIPAWHWNTYQLRWSGPVEPAQSLRLVILPRWLVALWRLATIVLGLAVLWWVGRDSLRQLRRIRLPLGGSAATAVLLAVTAAGSLTPADALAEMPSPQVLDELRERLLRAPDCVPDCASIEQAGVTAAGQRLDILLEINVLENLAVPVPGSEKGWLPETVNVDGAAAGVLYRDRSGLLWLPLEPGSRRVALGGRLPDTDRLEIAFPAIPRRVSVQARGWEVGGLRGQQLVSDSLELRRERQAGADEPPPPASTRFPPYLRVERTLTLGLDWSVATRVMRVAPAEGAISVSVPLLTGESVVSDGVVVRDEGVQVSLGSGQAGFGWRSTLARTGTLVLAAPDDSPWSERWQFRIGSIWHATLDGVPVYDSGEAAWQPLFLPLPGETLRLEVMRPQAVEGSLLAVDRASLQTRFGARSSESTLEFDYRSSLGGPHLIRLPASARLTRLVQDGNELPLPAEGEAVRIPTLPGSHSVNLTWRDDSAVGTLVATPSVDLDAPVSNISVGAGMPRNRWLLGLGGPIVGPAVLYWPALAALLLAAWLLGRVRLTPLATWQWFLLGLGFSTFAWPAFALVAGWLIVMGWRERWPGEISDNDFRARQAAVGLLSVVALATLVLSIPIGLLGSPDMHIVGNGSAGHQLNWFQDRSEGALPTATVFSLPLWIYKAAILLWALWLAFALVRWLPWAWSAFSKGGLWRPRPG